MAFMNLVNTACVDSDPNSLTLLGTVFLGDDDRHSVGSGDCGHEWNLTRKPRACKNCH